MPLIDRLECGGATWPFQLAMIKPFLSWSLQKHQAMESIQSWRNHPWKRETEFQSSTQKCLQSENIFSWKKTAFYYLFKVTQGLNPVLGANVTATVSVQGGIDITVDLYDAGAGMQCYFAGWRYASPLSCRRYRFNMPVLQILTFVEMMEFIHGTSQESRQADILSR